MLSYYDAVQLLQKMALSVAPLVETVPLAEGIGRICAQDVHAPIDVQPFDNAAMDGFAVKVHDVEGATEDHPVRLRKCGVVAAGRNTDHVALEAGTCLHVMTGAAIPDGVEAVVQIEDVCVEGDIVRFMRPATAGQHIRRAGEDFMQGDRLLSCGDTITVAHILPLATLGVATVTVFKKPKVLFIPTGTEIVDDLSQSLQHGEIYNSNKFYTVAFLASCGADVVVHDTIRDDVGAFVDALRQIDGQGYDVIVSSGAVSSGSFDFVRDGLEQAGAEVLYHKIKLKPGKPNLLARMPGGGVYFGLPGNPVATAVGLRFFVAEYLKTMRRQNAYEPVYARVVNGFYKKSGLHMILKGRMEYWDDGSITVDILDGQESFKTSPFLNMNCWVHMPEDADTIKSGDVIETFPLNI